MALKERLHRLRLRHRVYLHVLELLGYTRTDLLEVLLLLFLTHDILLEHLLVVLVHHLHLLRILHLLGGLIAGHLLLGASITHNHLVH